MLFDGDDNDVNALKGLLAKAARKTGPPSVMTIHVGIIAPNQPDAANDPIFALTEQSPSIPDQSGDNKPAKMYRLWLFLVKLCKRFFCRCFRLKAPPLLGLLIFLDSLVQGQNIHSPTKKGRKVRPF